MIPNVRRIPAICRILLLAGATVTLANSGCGSSGGGGGTGGSTGTGGSGGSSPDAKLDALTSLPDVALPKDLPPGTGGAAGTPDLGTEQTPLGGAGGTNVVDATLDVNVSGSEVGRDAGQVPDLAMVPDGGAIVDGAPPVDSGSYDGGSGSICQAPTLSHAYTVNQLSTIAWTKDNTLVTAGSAYPSSTDFGSMPLPNKGSADMFVAGIDPATGSATWIFTAGDSKDQYATHVATSSASTVGVIGNFLGTMTVVTGSPITNPSSTTIDYIAGIDGTTGTGVWSKSVNLGTGRINAIAGHRSKDYFVVCGAATNSAAQLGVTGATPGGGTDVVVAAIKASDGSVIWAKLFGGAMSQTCTSASIDDDGNVLLAGQYNGTLDFGSGALTPAPTGANDLLLWVAKLDGTTGAALAAQGFGASGSNIQPHTIAADAQGNVVVGGAFATAFSLGAIALTPIGPFDAFVVKLTSSLVPVWARSWGSAGSGDSADSSGIVIDSNGDPTVVGLFTGTIGIGPASAVLSANAPVGKSDVLIASLDGATGATTCAQHYGDSGPFALQGAKAVAINRTATGAGKDAIAIVGSFMETIEFPPTTALGGNSSPNTTSAYLLEIQP